MSGTAAAHHLRTQLAPVTIPASTRQGSYRNWARSYASTPAAAFQPTSDDQCRAILQLAALEGRVVRAVGSGHSPSDLPCTTGFMLRTDRLNRLIELNREKLYVVVGAGMVLTDLNAILASEGLAMSNLGSISETTIGGCLSTGTHGSGFEHGCIATQALALDLMLADGSVVRCSRAENPELFLATLCGLGATGLILRVTIQVERAFRLKEERSVMHIDDVIANLDNLAIAGDHTRMWWSPHTDMVSVMVASRTIEPPRDPSANWTSWFLGAVLGGHLAELLMFLGLWLPILEYYGNVLRARTGIVPGTFVGRSDKIFNVDCGFTQYTTEWAVPASEAKKTVAELREWLRKEFEDPKGTRPSMPVEIRFSAPDDILLSPAYGRRTCWIGIVKYKPYAFAIPFANLSTRFEDILKAHGGRPHWAKTHSFSPSGLRALYPRFEDFVRVLQTVDPTGVFRNEYIRRHLFEEHGDVGESIYAKDV